MRLEDPTLPGGNLVGLSYLAPFLLAGARCLIDYGHLLRNVRTLKIPSIRILLLFLSPPLLRGLDLLFMEWFLIRKGLKKERERHG